jgi:hypothetical protein
MDLNSKFFNNKWQGHGLIKQGLQISQKFLGFSSKTNCLNTKIYSIYEILRGIDEVKLPKPDYKYIHPGLKVEEVPGKWGFAPEEKIANLVITLNRLGFYTASSCQGHLNRKAPFPQLSFWNEEFFQVVAYLKNWGGKVLLRSTQGTSDEVQGKMFDVLFIGETLEEGQLLVDNFLEHIKLKAT